MQTDRDRHGPVPGWPPPSWWPAADEGYMVGMLHALLGMNDPGTPVRSHGNASCDEAAEAEGPPEEQDGEGAANVWQPPL